MKAPLLSVIVVCHDMPKQMQNTLVSLSSDYQQLIDAEDYEVVIVENSSLNQLPASFIASLPPHFHYHLRKEDTSSPAAAINFALARATGAYLGLMIDGAHLLTPGVVHYALSAFRLNNRSLVSVPVYHLGPGEQHESVTHGYDETKEATLLNSIAWRTDGYELFRIASNCEANPRGFLAPVMESNCYFAPRLAFEEIGGADLSFQQPGGGALNLHLFRQLGLLDRMEYYCLAGEGSFHQYHGGVTSGIGRQANQARFEAELQELWQGRYRFLERNPIVLGTIKPQALNNLAFSAQRMQRRHANCRTEGWAVWADDPGE